MQAVIALGSNLGDQVANLEAACRQLGKFSLAPVMVSSCWRTAPVGFEGDVPDFYNAVVVIETDLSAIDLLKALKSIERAMGRVRESTPQYESRTIDLDIIDLGGQLIEESGLSIPHPRAHERLFVLHPLLEVQPDFRFPGRPESLDELIRNATFYEVERFTPLNPWA